MQARLQLSVLYIYTFHTMYIINVGHTVYIFKILTAIISFYLQKLHHILTSVMCFIPSYFMQRIMYIQQRMSYLMICSISQIVMILCYKFCILYTLYIHILYLTCQIDGAKMFSESMPSAWSIKTFEHGHNGP